MILLSWIQNLKSRSFFSKGLKISIYVFVTSLILGKVAMSIAYGIMVFFFVGQIISGGKDEFFKFKSSLKDLRFVMKPILIFLAYCFISLLWSHHFNVNLQGFGKFFRNFLLIIIIFHTFKSVPDAYRFLQCLVFSAAFASVNGLIQYFARHDLFLWQDFWGDRVRASFPDPGTFSSYLSLFLPISVALLWSSLREAKKFLIFSYGMAAILITLGLYMSFTKNVFYFLALTSVFLFFFSEAPKKIKLYTGSIAYVALLVLFLSVPILSFFINKLGVPMKERLYLWSFSQKMIQDAPILGHGLNSYSQIHTRYFPAIENFPGGYRYLYLGYPHNGYLKMWVEIGLMGLILYLIIYFQILKKLWFEIKKSSNDKKVRLLCYAVSFLTFMCSSFFDTFMESTQTRYALWVVVGAMLIDFKVNKKEDAPT